MVEAIICPSTSGSMKTVCFSRRGIFGMPFVKLLHFIHVTNCWTVAHLKSAAVGQMKEVRIIKMNSVTSFDMKTT